MVNKGFHSRDAILGTLSDVAEMNVVGEQGILLPAPAVIATFFRRSCERNLKQKSGDQQMVGAAYGAEVNFRALILERDAPRGRTRIKLQHAPPARER